MCTDHVTIFQLHNVGSGEKMAAVMGPKGAFEGLQEGIRAGKIGSAAFSAHSLSVAAEMIRTGLFDAVQVPFNFVDCQAADEVIPLARTADMGIIAMKPLGGGLLDDTRLCFRYLQQFPDVVPDPGMETPEQMRQILHVMESAGPLTAEETGLIERYRTQLGTEWCHRCDYCLPCPRHISDQHRSQRKELCPQDAKGESAIPCQRGIRGSRKLPALSRVRPKVPVSPGDAGFSRKAEESLGCLSQDRHMGIADQAAPGGAASGAPASTFFTVRAPMADARRTAAPA